MRKLVDLSTSSSPRDIKEWLNNNREKMNEIDIKTKEGNNLDGFFSVFNNNHIKDI